ncbi:MAG: DUF2169 domain-containing protein [Sandaracinaceae bacterium]|nr:DUF2169 domain-containing protein [Sandaracinaceae bacterium]
MRLVTDSPLRIGWLPWAFSPTDRRLVVAVKATIELVREGVCPLASEQAFVLGDEPWNDDVEASVRYDADLALIKPQGEWWLTGTLRTRDPVRELACRARVGEREARFAVVGDRWWRPDGGQSEPVPFTAMPLCWERSFGGPGYDANPVGRGIAPDPTDAEGRIAVPNFERAERVLRSPSERPEPVGAWPIPRTWRARAQHLGTYDGAYVRERWPFFAEDFSWRYFQAAPETQRIAGYWRGDEEIELSHLHPAHRHVCCQLPGIKPRVFVHEAARPQGPLREVGLVLDTIAIDAGAGRAFLVWRGSTPIASDELAELAHLYLTHEPLGQARKEGAYLAAFVARLRAEWEAEHAFEAEPVPLPREPAPEPPRVARAEPERAPIAADVIAAQRDQAIAEGWPREVVEVIYSSSAIERAPADPSKARVELEAAIGAAERLGLPSAVIEALGRLRVPPAVEASSAPELPEVDPDARTLARAEVERRVRAGEGLAGLRLSDVDLRGLDLTGQDVRGSLLVRADLRGVKLDGARLDGASLDEAKLEGASARGASFAGASLALIEASGVDFSGAVLEDAMAERAMLEGAIFRGVKARGFELEEGYAVGALFESADLTDAVLSRTNFDEASFRGALLEGARLYGASLRRANLDQIKAMGLRAADGADLSEANVRWAQLEQASFSRSILIGTRFTESDLTRALFLAARLEGAQLLAVRARGARFDQARMAASSLAGADLYGARFEGADLRHADFANASAYQAEFWQADTAGARFEGTNLEGTKLA